MAQRPDRGEVATYIPELARADTKSFGLAVIAADGHVAAAGDCDTPFSIQSISKVFTLTLALGLIGDRLWRRVGREPSGSPFNSIVQLEFEHGVPRNPFINAGAIAVSDVILSGHQPREALGEILRFMRFLADDPSIMIDQDVAASEQRTGFRNFALANYMKSYGVIDNPVDSRSAFIFTSAPSRCRAGSLRRRHASWCISDAIRTPAISSCSPSVHAASTHETRRFRCSSACRSRACHRLPRLRYRMDGGCRGHGREVAARWSAMMRRPVPGGTRSCSGARPVRGRSSFRCSAHGRTCANRDPCDRRYFSFLSSRASLGPCSAAGGPRWMSSSAAQGLALAFRSSRLACCSRSSRPRSGSSTRSIRSDTCGRMRSRARPSSMSALPSRSAARWESPLPRTVHAVPVLRAADDFDLSAGHPQGKRGSVRAGRLTSCFCLALPGAVPAGDHRDLRARGYARLHTGGILGGNAGPA